MALAYAWVAIILTLLMQLSERGARVPAFAHKPVIRPFTVSKLMFAESRLISQAGSYLNILKGLLLVFNMGKMVHSTRSSMPIRSVNL